MRNKLILFFVLFLSIKNFATLVEFSESPARGYSLHGFPNEETARVLSIEQNKPTLVILFGPDWCPWSKKFYEDVLEDRKSLQDLKEVVLSVENLPEEGERIQNFKDKYGIQELPTFLLLSPQGEVVSHFGYLPWQTNSFVSYVQEQVRNYEEILARQGETSFSEAVCQELYERAKRLGWKAKVEEFLQKGLVTSKNTFFHVEKYASVLASTGKKNAESVELKKKIMSMDPKNQQGSLFKLAVLDFQMLEKTTKKEPEKVILPLVTYLKEHGSKDPDSVWKIEWMIGQFLFSRDKASEALHHVKLSYQAAPEDAKWEIGESMHYIESFLNQQSATK